MDYNFQSKMKPVGQSKGNGLNGKMITKTVNSTNSLVKPKQIMSSLNPPSNNQARPTSPKITKRVNSSSLVQPSQPNFIQSRASSKPNSATQSKLTSLKKPTITTFASHQPTKPLSVNSSANRLNSQQSLSVKQSSLTTISSRAGSATNLKSSLNSIKGKETKKLMVKDTISNSSFVPREKLDKLTKKHEELTNRFNFSSQIINKNQLAVDALSCLVNYMAVDLDAFDNPNLKKRIDHLERVERNLNENLRDLNEENEKVNCEFEFEKQRGQKEKESLLEMFEMEMKTVEKNYQDNLKVEHSKREKAEKDLLYLKQSLSKDKKIDFLNKEIESLKTVLELKDEEIKELRYRLDRTFVDQDEIIVLRNERDNLSLAKEQLEYSLNQKNEELKFVLQENTSLASLNSLTSTPLPNDRNNNSIVKKRKNLAKKQKLDSTESTSSKDDHVFVKPLSVNLHKDRFVRPSVDLEIDKADEYFEEDTHLKNFDNKDDKVFIDDKVFNDDELIKQDDEIDFVKPLVDEINFIKPLIDRPVEKSHDNSFDSSFKNKSNDDPVLEHANKLDSIETDDHFNNSFNQLDNSFNKDMEMSIDKSLNNSIYRSFDDKSLENVKDNQHSQSQTHSFDKPNHSTHQLNTTFTYFNHSNHHSNHSTSYSNSPDNRDDSLSKQFKIDEIKERCFKKAIERESPKKEQILEENDKFKRPTTIGQQCSRDNFLIKTCQIISDENEISIIKNKKCESVLDSGFCDL